jgi:hypothetical protein
MTYRGPKVAAGNSKRKKKCRKVHIRNFLNYLKRDSNCNAEAQKFVYFCAFLPLLGEAR